ncbi:MAG TPA: NAD(+) synthase [Candidatus Latescibacteria bacterium]|nr:NAD(+) synthase [Candidatus Latescibacterota bacterium]
MEAKLEYLKVKMEIDPERVASELAEFLRRSMDELEREGVVLGLSGGLDSAVTAALCRRAVGAERVLALMLPERDSDRVHQEDALEVVRWLGIRSKRVDLTSALGKLGVYRLWPLSFLLPGKLKAGLVRKAYKFYEEKLGETPFSAGLLGPREENFGAYLRRANAYYRAKHRLRMVVLYLHGELENLLVVGSANRTEYKVGFFVKHGCDHAADAMPLLGLYKTQVRALAEHLGVPKRIMDKPPSPDILPGIVDEEVLGLPYEQLDLVLLALDKGWGVRETAEALGLEEGKVEGVRAMRERSWHMRRVLVPSPKGD